MVKTIELSRTKLSSVASSLCIATSLATVSYQSEQEDKINVSK